MKFHGQPQQSLRCRKRVLFVASRDSPAKHSLDVLSKPLVPVPPVPEQCRRAASQGLGELEPLVQNHLSQSRAGELLFKDHRRI